jgi:hypothetical protein
MNWVRALRVAVWTAAARGGLALAPSATPRAGDASDATARPGRPRGPRSKPPSLAPPATASGPAATWSDRDGGLRALPSRARSRTGDAAERWKRDGLPSGRARAGGSPSSARTEPRSIAHGPHAARDAGDPGKLHPRLWPDVP